MLDLVVQANGMPGIWMLSTGSGTGGWSDDLHAALFRIAQCV
jgi:hypothetical protein